MARFLFWNIAGRPIADTVARLVAEHAIDVLVLAEPLREAKSISQLVNTIYDASGAVFSVPTIVGHQRTMLLTRYPDSCWSVALDDEHVAIWRLDPPLGLSILVAVVHLPSQLHARTDDRSTYAYRTSSKIRDTEKSEGHDRTIVFGDFNMDPFENGMLNSDAFHAVSDRRIANRKWRTILGARHPLLYNPMWNKFGDEQPGPPGTFYYRSSQPKAQFWHIFDQVLLRPSIVGLFPEEGLRVITSTNKENLLTATGRPNSETFSDHLPITFELQLENEVSQ